MNVPEPGAGRTDDSPAAHDRIDLRGARGVQIGDHNVQTNVTVVQAPAVRSAYLHQVRLIAPESLEGRGTELAELARFCTQDGPGAYTWWRAPAWAGKSALMSWFVLHPPQGVRMVAFFVTARYAGQSDRIAFLDVVMEQLAELLGRPMPAYLTEATREPHYRSLLDDAAALCESRGEKLVLLVDGLDEDQGVVVGPDAYSIAALLPDRPPTALRVVVAGRPHPPVPADVSDDHPLRDEGIVRELAPAERARAVRRDAERELKRLLYGTSTEQDLVGLLTASGGGLSGADLAALTGAPRWRVADQLSAVSGRTFARRTAPRADDGELEVYLLGHEELQRMATVSLEGAPLDGYRQRLRVWADGYRRRGWPADTPEYLFRGYFRMVRAVHDVPEMTACALDRARHDRMLDHTGGDTAALEEITAAQDALVAVGPGGLRTMALLSAHRDQIVERNSALPKELPAVWAALGRFTRAEELAYAMTTGWQRDSALLALVKVAAAVPDPVRAQRLARTVGDNSRAEALACCAEAVARIGDRTAAEALLAEIGELAAATQDPGLRVHALIELMNAAVACDDQTRAAAAADDMVACADGIADRHERVGALTTVCRVLVRSGDITRAKALAGHALAVARAVRGAEDRDRAVGWVAESLAQVGEHAQARRLLRTLARDKREWVTADLVRVIADAGDIEQAQELAGSLPPSSWHRGSAFGDVAEALAVAGNFGRAEALAESSHDIATQSQAYAALTQAMTGRGDLERAAEYASRISYSGFWLMQALKTLVRAAITHGEHEWAEDLVRVAVETARFIEEDSTLPQQLSEIAAVAEVVVAAGDHTLGTRLADDIEKAARAHTDRYRRSHVVETFADALAHCTDADVAGIVAERANTLAKKLERSDDRERVQVRLVRSVAAVAGYRQASLLANGVGTPRGLEEATCALAEGLAQHGDLTQAEAVARSIDDTFERHHALVAVAQGAADGNDPAMAEALLADLTHPLDRVKVMSALFEAEMSSGDEARAAAWAGQAQRAAATLTVTSDIAWALARLADALTRHGFHARAGSIAQSIGLPGLRVEVLSRAAQGAAASGDLRRAAELTESAAEALQEVETGLWQEEALAALTAATAANGDYDGATALVRSAEQLPNGTRWALPALVTALARAGRLQAAESCARADARRDNQARALAALAQEVGPVEGHRFVAEALRLAEWTLSADALAECAPEALADIAGFLVELSEEQPSLL
jgi:tetratricopeptide (TPR) repeat protein